MNIPENVEFYLNLLILIVLIVALAHFIYKGQQKGESRNRFYGRLLAILGMVCVALARRIERPDWLGEISLFIAAGVVITSAVLLFRD